ncbi:Pre-mRNA-splicing factor 18 [Thelohanellus kitauei]|uniref:Pre-mRNA-splicing factor 18 n=1 Tax=Thelohanellus kitauei TaxID=669202 RepID=A0A0C2MMC8_THEKT|nr:Pre-mRNA-splicing factor 18 [Thelohanellus kitauei]
MELDENKELTNEFQDTLEKIDKAVLMEHYNVEHNKKIREFMVLDSETTIESIKESAKLLGKSDDTSKDCEVLLSFCHLILSIWARDLNRRSLDVKLSIEGKRESARYEQTYSYLRPLLKKLKANANDAYLQMAIGNAPWPIGVTMVGIHPRTGRERISQHVAHVLNDETQRKYIQGVKRLMSYCQKTYPTDPSRSVEYGWVEGKYK